MENECRTVSEIINWSSSRAGNHLVSIFPFFFSFSSSSKTHTTMANFFCRTSIAVCIDNWLLTCDNYLAKCALEEGHQSQSDNHLNINIHEQMVRRKKKSSKLNCPHCEMMCQKKALCVSTVWTMWVSFLSLLLMIIVSRWRLTRDALWTALLHFFPQYKCHFPAMITFVALRARCWWSIWCSSCWWRGLHKEKPQSRQEVLLIKNKQKKGSLETKWMLLLQMMKPLLNGCWCWWLLSIACISMVIKVSLFSLR